MKRRNTFQFSGEKLLLVIFTILLFISCNNNDKLGSYEMLTNTVDGAVYVHSGKQNRLDKIRFINEEPRMDSAKSKSGRKSLKLFKNDPFGFSIRIQDLKPEEHFRISVWRYELTESSCSAIVIAADTLEKFYLCQHKSNALANEKGWKKMSVEFSVPKELDNQYVEVYVFNPDSAAGYFDDFSEYMDDYKLEIVNPRSVFVDERDGQTYAAVQIGSQTWMAQNLNFKLNDAQSKYYNNDSISNCLYGRLYTYDAANKSCPSGWRLPSDSDWKILEQTLGIGEQELSMEGKRGIDQGQQLKKGGDSGFNTLNAGTCDENGNGWYVRSAAFFWTSTPANDTLAICREIAHRTDIGRFRDNKKSFFSVRCLSNNSFTPVKQSKDGK